MSALLFSGRATFIVGVEEDPGGLATRVYVKHRGDGLYFLISDPEAREKVKRAWASRKHVIADQEELFAIGVLLKEKR